MAPRLDYRKNSNEQYLTQNKFNNPSEPRKIKFISIGRNLIRITTLTQYLVGANGQDKTRNSLILNRRADKSH